MRHLWDFHAETFCCGHCPGQLCWEFTPGLLTGRVEIVSANSPNIADWSSSGSPWQAQHLFTISPDKQAKEYLSTRGWMSGCLLLVSEVMMNKWTNELLLWWWWWRRCAPCFCGSLFSDEGHVCPQQWILSKGCNNPSSYCQSMTIQQITCNRDSFKNETGVAKGDVIWYKVKLAKTPLFCHASCLASCVTSLRAVPLPMTRPQTQ